MIKIILKDLIENIDIYYNKYLVYTKSDKLDLLDEVIIDDDIYDIKDNIEGFEYLLGLDQIKSVLNNVRNQKRYSNDLELCVNAINYYIENDAFMEVTEN